jgi:hypothetical protein
MTLPTYTPKQLLARVRTLEEFLPISGKTELSHHTTRIATTGSNGCANTTDPDTITARITRETFNPPAWWCIWGRRPAWIPTSCNMPFCWPPIPPEIKLPWQPPRAEWCLGHWCARLYGSSVWPRFDPVPIFCGLSSSSRASRPSTNKVLSRPSPAAPTSRAIRGRGSMMASLFQH